MNQPKITLLELIMAVNRCDDRKARAIIRRRAQSLSQRFWFSFFAFALKDYKSAWETLVFELARCTDANDVLETCRYWRRRVPFTSYGLMSFWFLHAQAGRVASLWDEYKDRLAHMKPSAGA